VYHRRCHQAAITVIASSLTVVAMAVPVQATGSGSTTGGNSRAEQSRASTHSPHLPRSRSTSPARSVNSSAFGSEVGLLDAVETTLSGMQPGTTWTAPGVLLRSYVDAIPEGGKLRVQNGPLGVKLSLVRDGDQVTIKNSRTGERRVIDVNDQKHWDRAAQELRFALVKAERFRVAQNGIAATIQDTETEQRVDVDDVTNPQSWKKALTALDLGGGGALPHTYTIESASKVLAKRSAKKSGVATGKILGATLTAVGVILLSPFIAARSEGRRMEKKNAPKY